ncbi:hypothetical protein D1007_19095 [Hordeum vulgare]|nr:hypothetical protein D1007_19095 [Hordeum vulgare]
MMYCVRCTMPPRKRKAVGGDHEEVPSKKPKCPPSRNTASPTMLLTACKDMPGERKDFIDEMNFRSLSGIKCDHLLVISMWLMLAGNTVIAPSTSNKRNLEKVKDLNWVKFIAEELHKALSKKKPTKGCLLFYNLLYIDAIDLNGLDIMLLASEFPINVWSNEEISQLLSKDVQADEISFGRLSPQCGKAPPPRRTRQTDSARKNVVEDSETESDFVGDDKSDDSDDEDDDTGYHVVYHGKKHHSSSCCGEVCEASVSKAAGVESSKSDDVDDVDVIFTEHGPGCDWNDPLASSFSALDLLSWLFLSVSISSLKAYRLD